MRRGEVPVASRRGLRRDTAARAARLPAARAPEEVALELAIGAHLPPGKTATVRLTDNRYSMVAVRRARTSYELRAHRMFAGAPPRIVHALARYLVHNDPRASGALGAFIEAHRDMVRRGPQRARATPLRTAGRFHDLQAVFDRLNAAYFGGGLEARITWGPGAARRGPRRSIKMGSYSVEDRLIRVHPALDRAGVPDYVVASIVFHEMLHGKYEVVRAGGRRCFHPRAFLEEERRFPEYDRASAWQRMNLDWLLSA